MSTERRRGMRRGDGDNAWRERVEVRDAAVVQRTVTTCMYVCRMSVRPCVRPSVRPSVCLLVGLSVCLSESMSVCLRVCLSESMHAVFAQ